MGETWERPGGEMVETWERPGGDMEEIGERHGGAMAQVKLSKTTGRSSNGRVPLYKPGDVGARRAPSSKVFPSR
ncbi:unnamed protein product [Boreogadus saida]